MKSCKGCTDRWVNIEEGTSCHSTCPIYAKMQERNALISKNRRKLQHDASNYSFGYGSRRAIGTSLHRKRAKRSIDTIG